MVSVEMELAELKERVERLEQRLNKPVRAKAKPPRPSKSVEAMTHDEVMAWLLAEGLIRPPTEEEKRLAAEWDMLSDEDKEAMRWELDHLPPGPMVSDIINENRR